MIIIDEKINKLTEKVIGAAIEVHRELGPGYLEAIYEEALAIEMEARGIPFSRQHIIHVSYKNCLIGESRLDFQRLIVELKAVESLIPLYTAQVISYLKATKLHLGLLINFNVTLLTRGLKRIALD
jgi:GxxExxY protein